MMITNYKSIKDGRGGAEGGHFLLIDEKESFKRIDAKVESDWKERKNKAKKAGESLEGIVKRKRKELRTKTLFLTYPRTDISKKEVKKQLWEIIAKEGLTITKHAISQEKHLEDDEMLVEEHLHVYLKLSGTFYDSTFKKLDLIDRTSGEYVHGNYQSSRSYAETVDYILKGGRYDICAEIRKDLIKGKFKNTLRTNIIKLARQGQLTRAMDLFEAATPPKKYLSRHRKTLKDLERVYLEAKRKAEKKHALYELKSFDLSTEQAKACLISLTDRDKATWVWGTETGTGKTQFMLRLAEQGQKLRILLCNDKNKLKDYARTPGFYDAIVLDDVDFKSYRREELIALLRMEVESDVRVLFSLVTLPPKLKRVIISNYSPREALEEMGVSLRMRPHVYRRISSVEITDPLYDLDRLPRTIFPRVEDGDEERGTQ